MKTAKKKKLPMPKNKKLNKINITIPSKIKIFKEELSNTKKLLALVKFKNIKYCIFNNETILLF